MPDEVLRAASQDFDEVTSLLDAVFGKGPQRSFSLAYRGMYRPCDESMSCVYIIRRDGRIVACAGLFPMRLGIGGRELSMAGVGGVAVDAAFRHQGLMQRLLETISADIRRGGYDLSWLIGLRRRYRRFGWEIAGSQTRLTMTEAGIQHGLKNLRLRGVTLEPLGDDGDIARRLYELHQSLPVRINRPAELFTTFLRQRLARPMVARDESGCVVGYLVLDTAGETVVELAAADVSFLPHMVAAAYAVARPQCLNVLLDAGHEPLEAGLGELCESATVVHSGNWLVLDWRRVLDALVALRAMQTPLPAGKVIIDIHDHGRFELALDRKGGGCTPTDAPADIGGDSFFMSRLLLGPLRPSQITRLTQASSVLDAWCPLPLSMPKVDIC